MGGYRHLLDTPSIPRILDILLESREGREEPSLLQAAGDEAHAAKALELLLQHGIVARERGWVRICEGTETACKVDQIVAFYKRVQRAARKNLVLRGILNATYYKCLVHLGTFVQMMEHEGFDEAETLRTIDEEVREGYVQRLKIAYRSRSGTRHKFFPFIPLYYYPHFVVMDADKMQPLRSRLENPGVVLAEEDYLLGNYPKELASQSRDYILREKHHIKEKIKNEAFDVWWYYRF